VPLLFALYSRRINREPQHQRQLSPLGRYIMGRYISKQTADGMPYRVWEPSVPRIRDEILESSIYLYHDEMQAKAGIDRGGSGVIISMHSETLEGFGHCYFVTNKHVIGAGFPTVRAVCTLGNVRIWPLTELDWEDHPGGDDLAAAHIDLNEGVDVFRTTPSRICITQAVAAEQNIGVGDDVFMVSRLLGYDGGERNEPIVRFGNLALGKPTRINQGPPRHLMQESYIVEMRSVCGCSGSPVFILRNKTIIHEGQLARHSEVWLLGIDWGHLPEGAPVVTDSGDQTDMRAETASAIATVVPAWKIKELLDVDRFKEQRRVSEEQEAERRKKARVAVMDTKPHTEEFTKTDFMNALKKASKKLE
jgi:hypothetical protein